jgi:hypothetical protein
VNVESVDKYRAELPFLRDMRDDYVRARGAKFE